MASGSAKELLSELMRARALRYLSYQKFKEFTARIDEIRRMLWSLAASVRRKYPLKRRKPSTNKRDANPQSESRQFKSGE
jgi:hypothetical protein